MDTEQLRDSLRRIDRAIDKKLLPEITRPYKDCEDLGHMLWEVMDLYRPRGLLKYLLEADVDACTADLTRHGLTYLTLLKAYKAKLDVDETLVDGSTDGPLTSVLAAGNFEVASAIDELMPREFGDEDDDQRFALTTMLRALAAGGKKDVQGALERLVDECAGVDNYDAVIEVARGLAEEDEKKFNAGLAAYLESVEDPSPGEADELDPGEEHVSVEALAFLQIAKKKKIANRVKHRMIPPELQKVKASKPRSGYPAWP